MRKCQVYACPNPASRRLLNCLAHRGWKAYQKRPIGERKRRHGMNRQGVCKTCGAAFIKANPRSAYCSLEHNPNGMDVAERQELILQYGPKAQEQWPEHLRVKP